VTGTGDDGHLLGTIAYVAPEQIAGGQIDGRADVYSLGCVLYECLIGQPPFRRDSDVAVVFAHLEDEPPAPSTLRPELPVALRPGDPDPGDRSARRRTMRAMEVRVGVVSRNGEAPPVGTPVRIELRDVSLADAPSTVVAAADTTVIERDDGRLAVATLEVDDTTWQRAAGLSFWARVAASGAERTSAGDWITMESVPLQPHVVDVELPVRRVG
jgi:serine/threonine protein kinase